MYLNHYGITYITNKSDDKVYPINNHKFYNISSKYILANSPIIQCKYESFTSCEIAHTKLAHMHAKPFTNNVFKKNSEKR